MEDAFEKGKTAVLNAVELAHPEEQAQISLAVDASGTHVGAVLQQQRAGQPVRPLAFYSAKLSAAQEKYSAFDRELLAAYMAVQHFKWFLEGRQFCLYTDHKPLTFALHKPAEGRSARQLRYLSFLAEFTSDVRHVRGRENVVADALSRPAAAVTLPSAASPVDSVQLAAAQVGCKEVEQLRTNSSLKVKNVLVDGVLVACDVSTGVMRPLVPPQLRQNIMQAVHGLAHAGIRATQRMVAARYVWRGCASDVAAWCKSCVQYGRGKVTQQEKTDVQKIDVPPTKFVHVHVDLVGLLPPASTG